MSVQNYEKLAAKAIEDGAYEDAFRLLLSLADHNSEYAVLALGWLYETGAVGTPDENVARSFYERAASSGSAAAHLYLGRLFLKNGQEAEARATFERGARLNNVECRSALARLNDRADEELASKAIERGDYEEAMRLLGPLAEQNSEYALLNLGWIHETGAIGAADQDVAQLYYERAASQGSATAQFNLGRIQLAQGKEAQARAAFEIGAQRGDVPSMAELGRMMVEGSGGTTDGEAGLDWLQKAAAKGHVFAQRELLALEERTAQSIAERLSVKRRIAALATKGAREMLKDPYSDKLR